MSPQSAPARMHFATVSTVRIALPIGTVAASITTTITTGTGTTGFGRVFVRR